MKLNKVDSLKGEITVPGDKSISHRAVMFGSLANGETVIRNFLMGADCLSTVSCFRKMGVAIEVGDEQVTVQGKGIDGLKEPEEVLDTGNSGTTTRLILGILAGLPFHTVLTGDESIAKRPMARVTEPLRQMGAKIEGRANGQFTPLSLRGGDLKGISYHSPMSSAQVKSSILLAGLLAKGETTSVTEPEKSRDHTERMLKAFGADLEEDGLAVSIKGGQSLTGIEIHVPGDISSAAFFLAAGAIVPDSIITLKNVGMNPTRTGMIEVLQAMGADLEIRYDEASLQAEPMADLTIKTSSLKGIDISGDLIPRLIDEIPIIALMATQAEGTTVIRNAEELKVKETNRIDTVVNELKKLGADIEPADDGMIIRGKSRLSGPASVKSHGDHRIGMMLAVASCITEGGLTLLESEAVNVSYPDFFHHLQQLSK
ncbi:3-phosphoshikimate 1-carboxyvinyltransferase [Metabacillus sp. GX 13764]|uniref:3-phosphoshikimate 1-carboxyvinyltransferase n=1 Tax=Metabacillus kandeliae TaxID=2900151 RepID=UPI001E37AE66|nr:3-phosphoshikimate 1-carboxyvinyltransferase [Metabacillus kandeliae]MCD7033376.1 3-phosphoshikimate 1-carboxyvinyltransferase [Metabacillus kandeliae]